MRKEQNRRPRPERIEYTVLAKPETSEYKNPAVPRIDKTGTRDYV